MICGTETLARALRQLTLIALAVTVLPVLPCETAFAQGGGYECGFTAPDSTIAGYSKGIPEPHIRDALIRLRVYSLTLKDALPGQSGWSQAEIDSQIARVRIDFAPHHIYFDWTSPGFVDTPQVVAEARSNASGLTSPMWLWRRL
jgi:hypothetical protein